MHYSAELNHSCLSGWTVRRPFLVIGFSAVSATAVALLLPLWTAPLLAAVLIGTCFVRRWRRPLWVLTALAAALFLLTTAGYRFRVVEPLAQLNGRQDTITGQVVETPRNSRTVTLEVSRAEFVPVGTRVSLFLPEAMTPRLWDTVTTRVTLSDRTLSGYLPGRGVHLFALPVEYGETCADVSDGTDPIAAQWSERLLSALRRVLPGEEGDVLAALCLGRDEGLSQTVREAFRGSGLSHLLVVSGLHLSLVVLALRLFFRRVGTGHRLSSALTIPMMALFMALVGVSPSVMRAGLMCLCWLVGGLCRRRSDGLNSLGMAAMVLLLINPYQLYHAGFQLSFLATAGVLCLTPRLCGWLSRRPVAATRPGRVGQKAVLFVYTALAVCFSAVLFTLPVSCYYYGDLTFTVLGANLLAVVPAGWVLLWGWVGLLCMSVPCFAWLGQPILWVAGYGARYLMGIARWCSFDWAQVPVTTVWQWLLLTVLCLLLIYALMARLTLRRALPPLLALGLLALPVGHLLATPAITVSVQPGNAGTLVLLEQGEKAALLVTHSRDLDEAQRLLNERSCPRLDWLVVADGAITDVGTLTELCRYTGNPQVVTTDREDWFAGATVSVERLAYAKPISLWSGCALTPTTKTWWRFCCDGAVAQVGGDARIPCPYPEGIAVYAGVPERVRAPAVVACPVEDLAGHPLEWAGEALILTDDVITFTVRPDGEWSVLPWL